MDDEDYLALIELVSAELRRVGAADLADERHYTSEDSELGGPRLIPPRERLAEMLLAFDRFLAVQDGALYRRSLDAIRTILPGEAPLGAVVLPIEGRPEAAPVDLGNAPDLSIVREDLAALVRNILEPDDGRGPLGAPR